MTFRKAKSREPMALERSYLPQVFRRTLNGFVRNETEPVNSEGSRYNIRHKESKKRWLTRVT